MRRLFTGMSCAVVAAMATRCLPTLRAGRFGRLCTESQEG
jgi:hypothetical protein